MSSVCSECGTIKKSGRSSCCGHGGSWFGKCGSAGSTHHEHTWSEGSLACNTWSQSRIVFGQQLSAGHPFDPPHGDDTSNSNTDTSANETSALAPDNTPGATSASTAHVLLSMPNTTSDSTSRVYGAGRVGSKAATEADTVITSASYDVSAPSPNITLANTPVVESTSHSPNNMLTTAFVNFSVSPTATVNTTAAIVTFGAKEAAMITDYVAQGTRPMRVTSPF